MASCAFFTPTSIMHHQHNHAPPTIYRCATANTNPTTLCFSSFYIINLHRSFPFKRNSRWSRCHATSPQSEPPPKKSLAPISVMDDGGGSLIEQTAMELLEPMFLFRQGRIEVIVLNNKTRPTVEAPSSLINESLLAQPQAPSKKENIQVDLESFPSDLGLRLISQAIHQT
ncbi:hypothetical protein PHJA_001040700 [Phtheirospermum japonicum]|uniref:Uncharacterized protein n=1 Tax=Phtheirospermum japonicum TaxID=374723 RepID=A0A830BN49_9LAMI|nr:hypothetical protein PHJA_001040700 [Phtheirospermum japonicum]